MSGSDGLRGVVALVTGAGQGIGRATALRLAAEGATVAGDDLYGGTYRLFDKVLAHTGGLEFTYADTTDPDAVEKALRPETKLLWIETPTNPLLTLSDIALLSQMVASVEEAVGLLVANAAYMSMGPFLEQDTQDWWHQIDTNLSGTFYLVRAVVPGMRRLGGGRIVIVSSEWGVTGWPNASAYAASKAGLISLG